LIAVVFIDEFAKGTRISYFHPRINLKIYLFSALMARKNKGQESQIQPGRRVERGWGSGVFAKPTHTYGMQKGQSRGEWDKRRRK
jgi:hypothetical protein